MSSLTSEFELVNGAADVVLAAGTNTSTNWQIANHCIQTDLCQIDNALQNRFDQHMLEGKNISIPYQQIITSTQTTVASKDNTANIATNTAAVNGLVTQCDGLGLWSYNNSYYVFHHPDISQQTITKYCLIQHGTSGRTYLNGVDNLDISVNDNDKRDLTATTSVDDNTDTYIRPSGNDAINITSSLTTANSVNGVHLRHNGNDKIQVGSSSTTIIDNVNAKIGIIIEDKDSDMVSDGSRQLKFINPFGGNTNLNDSWAMGFRIRLIVRVIMIFMLLLQKAGLKQ